MSHETVEQSLAAIDLKELTESRTYYPSPQAWEDEVLYFLLADRFSDGREKGGFRDNDNQPLPEAGRTTPLFSPADEGNTDREQWFRNGQGWCGGNLSGLKEKLGYLKRLGITAVWISPLFKQTTGSNSYHGYGIQNFLDIDPHFGTREELKSLVEEAHRLGIRVVLDIILNHAGNVFAYKDGHLYQNGRQWSVGGFRKNEGDQQGALPFEEIDLTNFPDAWPDGAVWPQEFQPPANWTRKGEITEADWDRFPAFIEGDFFSLKDINHGCCDTSVPEWDVLKRIRTFQKARTLEYLARVFKFWIAYADLDGYRIDTVKHMEPGAVRYFTNVIHEFAQSIGKENFYLIGEITGGRHRAVNLVDTTGLDAALGIDDIQDKLEFLAKGWRSPGNPDGEEQVGYFDLFNNSLVDGKNTHQWFARRIVTMFDDHDQVGTDHKFRFCGQGNEPEKSVLLALGLNLATLGVPCIYYGTEQAFNGADLRADDKSFSDTFLRECMFGGGFGSRQSSGRHFFNEEHPVYQFTSRLCALRKEQIALRRGRQFLRKVSASGQPGEFYYPTLLHNELRWVVAWSRIFNDTEILGAVNTDLKNPLKVWITVDAGLTPAGSSMQCLFSTLAADTGQVLPVADIDGRATIQITVPAAGFVLYRNEH